MGISSTRVIPTAGSIVFPECAGIRLHAAPTQSGGDAAAWFAASNGLSLPEMAQLVADTPRGPATPLFLPQLEGERAPLWDSDLRAAFLGISRRTDRADLARAVYEGVSFAARWALETVEASSGVSSTSLSCGGGGFRADAWNQIRADVFGRELHRLEAREPGVLGAATLAAVGCGSFEGLGEAFGAMARFDRSFTPDARRHEGHSALYDLYRSTIAGIAEVNADIARTSQTVV